MTFNINLWSIKKVIFDSLGYPVLPWQQVCQEYSRFSEVIVSYVSL